MLGEGCVAFCCFVRLLNLRHHQAMALAMRELLHLQERWKRTPPCRRWFLKVSLDVLICFEFLLFLNELLRGFVIWGWFCCVGGGLRCDLLFCEAAEPPPSSDNDVGAAGAAALAGALQKNTSLVTLDLGRES